MILKKIDDIKKGWKIFIGGSTLVALNSIALIFGADLQIYVEQLDIIVNALNTAIAAIVVICRVAQEDFRRYRK